MREEKKWIRVLLLLLGFVLIAVSIFLIIKEIRYNQNMTYQEELYRDLAEHAVVVIPPGLESAIPGYDETAGSSVHISEDTKSGNYDWLNDGARRVIDFEKLCSINPDIVAWLYIPGTEVDYPILQREDNTYYLSHNLDGSSGLPGCIYAESYNATDFTDSLTVLYGHNMKNGTMFGNLKAFKEKAYFEEHRTVYLYLPDRTNIYVIVAASLYSDEHLLYDYIETDQEGAYTEFTGNEALELMEKVRAYKDSGAVFREEEMISKDDTLLVLSTCDKKDTQRYLVIAKQIDKQ